MTQLHRQNHATCECKYHMVFIPKYRKKAIFGGIKMRLGDVFHELARRRESKIEEGHLMPDHVHMLISIPPKYSVAEVIGFIKERVRSGLRKTSSARRAISHRAQVLGTWLFRLDGGAGRRNYSNLYQEPGATRPRNGSVFHDPIVRSPK